VADAQGNKELSPRNVFVLFLPYSACMCMGERVGREQRYEPDEGGKQTKGKGAVDESLKCLL